MRDLAQRLIRANRVSRDQLEQAEHECARTGDRLAAALVRLGFIEEHALTEFIGAECGVPVIDPREVTVDPPVLQLLPVALCEKHVVYPVRHKQQVLIVAMADPSDLVAIDEIRFLTQLDIAPVTASYSSIVSEVERVYRPIDLGSVIAAAEAPGAGEDAIVKLVDSLLIIAVRTATKYFAVEPSNIWYRSDGRWTATHATRRGVINAVVRHLCVTCEIANPYKEVTVSGGFRLCLGTRPDVGFVVHAAAGEQGMRAVAEQVTLDELDAREDRWFVNLPDGDPFVPGWPLGDPYR